MEVFIDPELREKDWAHTTLTTHSSIAQDSKSVVGPGFRQRFGALRVRSSCNVDAGNEIYTVSNYGASVFELFFAPSMPKQDIGFFSIGRMRLQVALDSRVPISTGW